MSAKVCPECGSDHIRFFGTGTQKVEEDWENYSRGKSHSDGC